jgi:hypothetical protein
MVTGGDSRRKRIDDQLARDWTLSDRIDERGRPPSAIIVAEQSPRDPYASVLSRNYLDNKDIFGIGFSQA